MDVDNSQSPNKSRAKKRDTYLDFTRGVMILSVIHIHTVYWSLKPLIPDIVGRDLTPNMGHIRRLLNLQANQVISIGE